MTARDVSRRHVRPGGWIELAPAGTVTTSGTDLDSYWPAEGYICTPQYRGLLLVPNRTAETGACTALFVPQMYNPITEVFTDMRDGAGAILSTVVHADGVVDQRVLRIYPGIIGADADGVLLVNTLDKWVDQNMPPMWRVRLRSGGTTVTNTFSLLALPLV